MEVVMTVLGVVGIIALFFLLPYLTGNIYDFVCRKKTKGIVTTYLSGMVLLYAMLMAIQLVIVKFKFNLS